MFFLVWREGGSVPTFKHPTRDEARKEAERLAKANPDAAFHVLALASTVKVERTPPIWIEQPTKPYGLDPFMSAILGYR